MAVKKSPASSSNWIGGTLVLLGVLVYVSVIFTWYSGGAAGSWLSAAQFLGPFVAAGAVVLSVSLFFMSLGMVMGKQITVSSLWKYIMADALFTLVISGGTSVWFYAVIGGFILTYVGAAMAYS